jgi:hypothetical protein
MTIKQKVKSFLLSGLLVGAFFTGITVVTPQLAAADDTCAAGSPNCCAGVKTSIISCDQAGGTNADPSKSGVWGILILAINILTAGVGIAAIGGVVYGAVLYASAGGSQEQVKKAITTFTNVGIGVVAYALMWALLNFLVPGGVFN